MLRKYATAEITSVWKMPRVPSSRALRKAAHRVAFDYEPRPGFLYFRSRMISSRTNDNHDNFPPEEIEKGYKTFLGKPVFVNHNNDNHHRARGVIVAVALHRDRNPDGSPDTWAEGLHELDAEQFPKLAKAVISGRVNRTSMGVDVDKSQCLGCGNWAENEAEYCPHLPAMKGKKLRKRNAKTGKLEEHLIAEKCVGLHFFENSLLVEDPADPTAYVVGEVDTRGLKKAASRTAATMPGEPDFRDHIPNPCVQCGKPVHYARGLDMRGRYPWKHSSPLVTDHDALPSDFSDKRPSRSHVYGGTHCLMCHEPVQVSLGHLDTETGGWSHHDGMKRDHPAIPADAWKVYNSIPGKKAEYEQAVQQMGDRLHRQFEEMSGHPLPRRPRGDEDQMPLDPFTASEGGRDAQGNEYVPGYGDDPRFDGVSLKKDEDGYFVTTHRARSTSYPSPEKIPGSKIEFIRSTGMRRTAEDTSYRMQHQGPDPDDGEGLHEIGSGKVYPRDFHEHPDWYGAQESDPQTMDKIRRSRGWPSRKVTVYRSLPSPHREVNTGDWVTTSAAYARQHGRHQTDPAEDWPVVKFTARAEQLRNDGNSLEEWSYHGPRVNRAQIHFSGGANHRGKSGRGRTDSYAHEHEPDEMYHSYEAQSQERRQRLKAEREARESQWQQHEGARMRRQAADYKDPDSDWVTRFDTPLGSPESDDRVLQKFGKTHPHQAAISMAQRRTRWDHPKLGMELPRPDPHAVFTHESHDAGRSLEHMLIRGGIPEDTARGAFVAMHRDPMAGTSNMAHDTSGHLGAVLHPERWDYGTLAHEAAHHLVTYHNAWPFNDSSHTDADIHGPQFARAYAQTLGMVSKGAGEDFLRHHGDASALISNYRSRIHGLPRIDQDPSQHEAARLYEKPGDHPFFQRNPVSADNIIASYKAATAGQREQGHRWYSDAQYVAKALGKGDAHKGAGVLSAYSPRSMWPVNMFNAARALSTGRAPGPGEGTIMRSHQKSAQRILDGEDHEDVLKAPKTKAFAHLIEHGGDSPEDAEAGRSHVVVDRHALSVAAGRRLGKEDADSVPFGEGSKERYYDHVADKYREAAGRLSAELGQRIAPHQVQAVTWLQQISKNQAEDAESGERGAKGRRSTERGAWNQWGEHARQHHPDIPELHMHARRKLGYGDVTVPPLVDTLQSEECPVCGEAEVYNGQRCPVCGYTAPPDFLRDPDVGKAQEMRQQLEEAKEEDNPQGSWPDAQDQLQHPDQIAPDGVPMAGGGEPPDGLPQRGDEDIPADEEEEGLPQQGDGEEPPPEDEELEGEQEQEEGQEEQEAGAEEEQAGEQEEQAAEEEEEEAAGGAPDGDDGDQPRKRQRPPAGGRAMGNANRQARGGQNVTAQLRSALAENNALRRHLSVLDGQLRFMAHLAGCSDELEAIRREGMRRQGDVMNPAQPVPDPPQEPSPEGTEQALQPETEGDPSRPGTEPGSTNRVPAAQTTTAITPGAEIQTPPATNLIDVTAPVQGTNPSQDGGVPLEQRRIETDVRVNPDMLATGQPGSGGQVGQAPGTMFPWVMDSRPGGQGQPQGGQQGQQRQGSVQSPEDRAGLRVMSSVRLARLRVQAGLASDDLAEADSIQRDASLTQGHIEHEIGVLSKVASRAPQGPPQRPVQRTAARRMPAMASAPSMAPVYGSAGDGDAEDIFLGEW